MTNSRNKAIPSSTYVPVTMYPTIPWRVSFQYAPHIHNDVSLSSPLKRIERKVLQLLPERELLYSTDLTYIVSAVVPELELSDTVFHHGCHSTFPGHSFYNSSKNILR